MKQNANYAVIYGLQVVNIIVWDGVTPWSPPDGMLAVRIPEDQIVQIGFWYYSDAFWADPPAGPA